jgi:hypothetical protein
MTEEELNEKVRSKQQEINELLVQAHLKGLRVQITEGKQRIDTTGTGQGFRSDLIGYEATVLQITLVE